MRIAIALLAFLLPLLPQSNPDRLPLLLLIIDFNDFMCPSCIDSILEFCHSLPPPIRAKHLWGIVVFNQICEKTNPLSKLIMKKKLQGFIQANQLNFPILPDFSQYFISFISDGSCLLVLRKDEPALLIFSFPITQSEKVNIIRVIYAD